ncbi:hypothetical protein [Frankia sp. Cr2]|uniref:hypothetical protein n=1 Tax=Frankia sp. Cr2 TaxID=3073932 RepID=UPI002AD41941|nr:hypothetical protein [Frankia sp. Cr2]
MVTPARLLAALDSFTGASITLHTREESQPVLFTDTPDGINNATAFRHLLMPISQ